MLVWEKSEGWKIEVGSMKFGAAFRRHNLTADRCYKHSNTQSGIAYNPPKATLKALGARLPVYSTVCITSFQPRASALQP